jgi:isoleucyl-tRNA synthetase
MKVLVASELSAAFERRYWSQNEEVFQGPPQGRTSGIFLGSQLAGTIARHPMHKLGGFFAKPRPFLPGDFVTTDQGTGLVHMSPDHGEDDFELCRANGIDPVFAVDAGGMYRPDWAWLGGQGSVINAKFNAPDGPICSDLREAGGLLAASADFKHSYPHSWRSKAKVIYRCTPQWFIAMDKPSVIHADSPSLGRARQRWENEGGHLASPHEATLREVALASIDQTRFVPEKGRNRLRSMVEGRPDWVISRQRAWGVPIALFVHRKSGELLVDAEVNQRIVAAISEQGVDAWTPDNAAAFLGEGRNPDDYEMVTDILDVWFDSGCTHVFTLESGHWPEERWPADLYLEGSDQHRGWFQSSLLESCGTRGRAPYDAVLTHGFTMDSKGMKMSKSLGNTINPLDLMRDYGADILRLWALSVDFTEDHRIGKEILAGVADQYRKLRNTFRYLLGALEGFSEEERLDDVANYPELEQYILTLLAEKAYWLRVAINNFDFNSYARILVDFCNQDLSAFYFDVRKDCLYCEVNPSSGTQTHKRRAYRTVLDTLFQALVRWSAPILVFTTEEVWSTRYPDGGSVHLLEWPQLEAAPNDELQERWNRLRGLRMLANGILEQARAEKLIGSSLEADVFIEEANSENIRAIEGIDLEELLIVSKAAIGNFQIEKVEAMVVSPSGRQSVSKTDNHKCGRCWRFLPEVNDDGDLCARCEDVLNG